MLTAHLHQPSSYLHCPFTSPGNATDAKASSTPMLKSHEASSTLKMARPPQRLSHPRWHYSLCSSSGLYSNLGCTHVYTSWTSIRVWLLPHLWFNSCLLSLHRVPLEQLLNFQKRNPGPKNSPRSNPL